MCHFLLLLFRGSLSRLIRPAHGPRPESVSNGFLSRLLECWPRLGADVKEKNGSQAALFTKSNSRGSVPRTEELACSINKRPRTPTVRNLVNLKNKIMFFVVFCFGLALFRFGFI